MPTCNENSFIKLNEYKISLECNNGHKFNDIIFNEFNNNQKIDLSKIICEDCKKVNKFNTYDQQFFRCLTCKKNLCPLCKSKHDKNHDIIDYEQKNYICSNHNENFSSYCNNCKINLCIECESSHKDKENIIMFRDLLPKKDLIKSQLNELKIKIDIYKEVIDKLKQDLDNIILNLEIYYSLNDNLIKNYEKKKRNYQMLINIKEMGNNNDKILSELKHLEIEKEKNFDLYSYTLNLLYKMKNIQMKEKKEKDKKEEKEEKVEKVEKDLN